MRGVWTSARSALGVKRQCGNSVLYNPTQNPKSLEGAWTVKPPSHLPTGVGFTRDHLARPQVPGPHPTPGVFKETALEGNLLRGLLGAKSTGRGLTIRQGVCTSLGWLCLVLLGYLWIAVLQVISRKGLCKASSFQALRLKDAIPA